MSLHRPLISFLKLKEISNLLLCCVYLQMCTLAVVCVCRVREPLSWFSSLLPPWVPGIQPRSSGLCSKGFQVLSPVTHLLECLFVKTCFRVCVWVCVCVHMQVIPCTFYLDVRLSFYSTDGLSLIFVGTLILYAASVVHFCFHKVQKTLCSQL